MSFFVSLFYSLFLYSYFIVIRISALWNSKAQLWIKGRKEIWQKLENKNLYGCIWFHASSLGEFEQINFLIQSIRLSHPSKKILLTFFSPSGFEQKKDYPFADCVTYLPFDFNENIVPFIEKIKPSAVYWVRYEFWLNVLSELNRRAIPLTLLNGVFRTHVSPFYRPLLKRALSCFDLIFVINKNSQGILKDLGFESQVLSDTRFDRMNEIRYGEFTDEVIDHFKADKDIIIFGSTWSQDETIIAKLKVEKVKFVIVPHEIDSNHIEEIKLKFPNSQTYSSYNKLMSSNTLIVDKIGLLSKLYRYGKINYVGGGFNKVVHSLIEPMSYGAPIIIGPNIDRSEEAIELVHEKLVYQIQNSNELSARIRELIAESSIADRERMLNKFDERCGSTNKLIRLIK